MFKEIFHAIKEKPFFNFLATIKNQNGELVRERE